MINRIELFLLFSVLNFIFSCENSEYEQSAGGNNSKFEASDTIRIQRKIGVFEKQLIEIFPHGEIYIKNSIWLPSRGIGFGTYPTWIGMGGEERKTYGYGQFTMSGCLRSSDIVCLSFDFYNKYVDSLSISFQTGVKDVLAPREVEDNLKYLPTKFDTCLSLTKLNYDNYILVTFEILINRFSPRAMNFPNPDNDVDFFSEEGVFEIDSLWLSKLESCN